MTAEEQHPSHSGPTLDPEAEVEAEGGVPLQAVEPGYVQVIRARTLLAWLPLIMAAVAVDRAVLDGSRVQGLLLIVVPLIAAVAVVTAPKRIWLRLGYALEPAMLRVVRGWWWHTDTLVPLVRVQHLDIARGPLDKMFGTASLVVHTAGTHNSTVRLPGVSPDRAAELATVIRSHIQADVD